MWRCHAEPFSDKIGELIVDGRIYLSSKVGVDELSTHPGYGVRAVYNVSANGRNFLVIPLSPGDVDDPSFLFKKEAPCPE